LGALAAVPIAAWVGPAVATLAREEVGLVSMHGKWGRPPGPLAQALAREGYRVDSPEMPWSTRRQYDTPYEVALDEIRERVERLRAAGARRIVLIGHSFGANGALAYQAVHGDADALVLLAPGHSPGGWYLTGLTRSDVDRATALAAEGRGNEWLRFDDPNQNATRNLLARVEVYLSYFRPRGLGNMYLTARRIGRPVPTLVVNSSAETASQGRQFVFDGLPPDPQSVYVEVAASHAEAPEAARDEVSRFLDAVREAT